MKAKFNHHLPPPPDDQGTQVFDPMISGEDLANLTPANHLWQPPDDFPQHYRKQLAGELDVHIIYQHFMGPNPSDEWTIEIARAMINLARQRIYQSWREGRPSPYRPLQ